VRDDLPEPHKAKGIFALAAAGIDVTNWEPAPYAPQPGRETDADCVWVQWSLADQVRVAKALIEKRNTDLGRHTLYTDYTGDGLVRVRNNCWCVLLDRLTHWPLDLSEDELGWNDDADNAAVRTWTDAEWEERIRAIESEPEAREHDLSLWADLVNRVVFRDAFSLPRFGRSVRPPLAVAAALAEVRDWKLPRLDRIVCLSDSDGHERHILEDWQGLKPGYHADGHVLVFDGTINGVAFPWSFDDWGAAADSRFYSRRWRSVRGRRSRIITEGSQRAYGPRAFWHTSTYLAYTLRKGQQS
jgi:hypothetical protein